MCGGWVPGVGGLGTRSRPISARPTTARTRGTSVPSYAEHRARTLAQKREAAAGVKDDLISAWDNPLTVKERYDVDSWVPPGGVYMPTGLDIGLLGAASDAGEGDGWAITNADSSALYDDPIVAATTAAAAASRASNAAAAALVGPPLAAAAAASSASAASAASAASPRVASAAVASRQASTAASGGGAAIKPRSEPSPAAGIMKPHPPPPSQTTKPPPRAMDKQSLASWAQMDQSIRTEAGGGMDPKAAKPVAVPKPQRRPPTAAATIPGSEASVKLSSEEILQVRRADVNPFRPIARGWADEKGEERLRDRESASESVLSGGGLTYRSHEQKLQKRMRHIHRTQREAARLGSARSLRGSRPPSRGAPNSTVQLKQQQLKQRPASAPVASSNYRTGPPPTALREGFSFFRRDGWAPLENNRPPLPQQKQRVLPQEQVRLVRAKQSAGVKAPVWPLVIDISPTSLTAALLAEEDAEKELQREKKRLGKVYTQTNHCTRKAPSPPLLVVSPGRLRSGPSVLYTDQPETTHRWRWRGRL